MATLPVQPHKHICPQDSVVLPQGDLLGRMERSSDTLLSSVSEPVPLLRCVPPDPTASRAERLTGKDQGELKVDDSSPCVSPELDPEKDGNKRSAPTPEQGPGTGRVTEVLDLDRHAAVDCNGELEPENAEHGGANLPQEGGESPTETLGPGTSSFPSPPLSPGRAEVLMAPQPVIMDISEGYPSVDQLRIVKHKPSAIVFSDHDPDNTDSKRTFVNESSDSEESSSASDEEGDGDDDEEEDDDDVFTEMSHYKEFLVCHRLRHVSRNRRWSGKRQEVLLNSTSACLSPANKSRPESTGDEEEDEDDDVRQNKQVRLKGHKFFF